MIIKKNLMAAVVAAMAAVSFTTDTVADSLTVVSFGGAYGAAQKKHMIDPYTAKTGTKILFEDYSGGIAEIKSQVESGNVQWDVVDIETIDLERACAEGLLEVISHDILLAGDDGTPAMKDFVPAALANECGVGNILWSVVYAYNTTNPGPAPQTIQDFFNTSKFPGKRALRKRPQVNLEWALLADGVAAQDVYKVLSTPAGQERALKKLDTIKKDVVWFDSWSQAPQLLNDGGAAMAQSANGRIYAAIKEEARPFKIVWSGHSYDLDVWAVVKGSKNKAEAMKFVAFATGTKPLSGMPDVAYGPTRKSASALIDPAVLGDLPSAHLKVGLKADGIFWADYGEALGEKFNEWLLK